MKQRTICVVTGTRAEYGLLHPLLKELTGDNEIRTQIIATGAHLSPEFGLSYKEIEKDGFPIDLKIEMLLSADTPSAIAKSMGLAMISFGEAFQTLKPDIVVLHGDRYEIFAAASAALVAGIPIAHISGGEVTEGANDDAFRHCLSKMAHLHFTSTEVYRQRVIQLGEAPERVFNVGCPSVDNIKNTKLMDLAQVEERFGRPLMKRNLLITFHPVTLEKGKSTKYFEELLQALDQLPDTLLIFTEANADSEGRLLIEMTRQFVAENPDKTLIFQNMGRELYLSSLQFVDSVIGNSSSGITEAPSFKIGTINIGDRQKGRIRATSVIDCGSNSNEILEAIEKLYSNEFQSQLPNTSNLYGGDGKGEASRKTKDIIKSFNLTDIVKKSFYDLQK